jgi:hypothetical protein
MIHAQMAQLPSFRSFPTSKCIPSSKWFTTRVEQIIHNPLETGIFHIIEVYCYTVILCCPIANYLVVSSNWESCSSFGLSILCVGWKGLSKSIGQSSFSLLKVPFGGRTPLSGHRPIRLFYPHSDGLNHVQSQCFLVIHHSIPMPLVNPKCIPLA